MILETICYQVHLLKQSNSLQLQVYDISNRQCLTASLGTFRRYSYKTSHRQRLVQKVNKLEINDYCIMCQKMDIVKQSTARFPGETTVVIFNWPFLLDVGIALWSFENLIVSVLPRGLNQQIEMKCYAGFQNRILWIMSTK